MIRLRHPFVTTVPDPLPRGTVESLADATITHQCEMEAGPRSGAGRGCLRRLREVAPAHLRARIGAALDRAATAPRR